MSEKPTLLRLEFIEEPSLVLERTFFQCPESQSSSETVRNNFDGISFKWGKTPAAFSLLILDYLIWCSSQNPEAFSFHGVGSGGAAGTLYWLVRDKDEWPAKVFGTSKKKAPLLYDILDRDPRSSKSGAAPPDVSITVKLPPAAIHVVLGGRQLETDVELRNLWERIKVRSVSFWVEEPRLAVEKQIPIQKSPEDSGPLNALPIPEAKDEESIITVNRGGTAPEHAREATSSWQTPVRHGKLWVLVGFCALLLLGLLVPYFKGPAKYWADKLTIEEKQKITELEPALRGENSRIFEVFAKIQDRVLLKESIIVTSFTYSQTTYTVPVVYTGTLLPSLSSMRFNRENSSLVIENAALTLDKERTLLMPVESFRNDAPAKKTHHGSLKGMIGLLPEHVLKRSHDQKLLMEPKAELAEYFQEALTKELKPILRSDTKVKVLFQ